MTLRNRGEESSLRGVAKTERAFPLGRIFGFPDHLPRPLGARCSGHGKQHHLVASSLLLLRLSPSVGRLLRRRFRHFPPSLVPRSTRMLTRRSLTRALSIAAVAAPAIARAREAYPARPIRLIVPWPPGGGVGHVRPRNPGGAGRTTRPDAGHRQYRRRVGPHRHADRRPGAGRRLHAAAGQRHFRRHRGAADRRRRTAAGGLRFCDPRHLRPAGHLHPSQIGLPHSRGIRRCGARPAGQAQCRRARHRQLAASHQRAPAAGRRQPARDTRALSRRRTAAAGPDRRQRRCRRRNLRRWRPAGERGPAAAARRHQRRPAGGFPRTCRR